MMVNLYKGLAVHYDKVYHYKNYEGESKKVHDLIKRNKKTGGKELLDVACGTGAHIQFLRKHYTITGMDISPAMLAVAKSKYPKIKFYQRDMTSFDFGKEYDALTCLFSAIGHLKNYRQLSQTFDNFYHHTKKGGVVIIEPWVAFQDFHSGTPHISTYESDDLKITRASTSTVKGKTSIIDMHYLIAKKGKPVEHYVEKLELTLFDHQKTLDLLIKAGFSAHYQKRGLEGRGLFIAKK